MDPIAAAYRRLLELRADAAEAGSSGAEREKLLESALEDRPGEEIVAIREPVRPQETATPTRKKERPGEGRLDLLA